MKNARYFIAGTIGALCVFVVTLHAQKKAGPAVQSWEYKTILRHREFHGTRPNDFDMAYSHSVASDWSVCSEDDKPIECPGMPKKLAALGSEGWELVVVTPRSSELNDNYQGATDDDLWVFKRPKQ